MRTVALLLAGLCWVLVGLSLLWVFIMVFKPRTTDADMIPATMMYSASIGAAGCSLIAAFIAWRQKSAPGPELAIAAVGATMGLVLPGLIVLLVKNATQPPKPAKPAKPDQHPERDRRMAYHPDVEKAVPIELSASALEWLFRKNLEETNQKYQGKVLAISGSFMNLTSADKEGAHFASPFQKDALRFYMTPSVKETWNKEMQRSFHSKDLTLRCLYGGSIEEKGTFGGVDHYALLLSCIH